MIDPTGIRSEIVSETEAELERRQGVVDATYDWLEALGLHPKRQSYIELEAELTERSNQAMGRRLDALA